MRGHGPYTTTDGRNFALLGQRHSARAVYGTPAAKLTCALYWSVDRAGSSRVLACHSGNASSHRCEKLGMWVVISDRASDAGANREKNAVRPLLPPQTSGARAVGWHEGGTRARTPLAGSITLTHAVAPPNLQRMPAYRRHHAAASPLRPHLVARAAAPSA